LKLSREVKEPQIGTEDELYSSLIKPSGHLVIGDKKEIDKATWRGWLLVKKAHRSCDA